MKRQTLINNGLAAILALCLISACGKQAAEEEAVGTADGMLQETIDSDSETLSPNHRYGTSATTSVSDIDKEAIKGKVQAFVQVAKPGIQGCKADLRKSIPQQSPPKSIEEAKQRLQTVMNFFKTNQASLSAECKAFLTQLKGFRDKIAARKGQ